MINDVSSAMNAYQQALGRISGAKPAPVVAEQTDSSSGFGDILKSAMDNVAGSAKKAENLSMMGLAGKADVQDVIMAISNAEQTLDTVVAFRDTAIKAYKEIIQMNI